MKQVLSIDIDALFNGETFAEYIQHDVDSDDSWSFIRQLNKKDKYGIDINIDEFCLNKVAKILREKCINARVKFIEEHDEILPILDDEKESAVYNIDFHCDTTYGGDDKEPNIENWVRHGWKRRTIKEYHWICRPMSDNCQRVLPYTRDNIEDISLDLLPNFDLVVICISRHFTPMEYWNILPKYLARQMSGEYLNYFKECNPFYLPKDLFEGENMEDYLLDGTLPDIARVFRYKDCYMVFEEDGHNISIFNKGKPFAINVCKEVIDYIVKTYSYATFTWDCRIRNHVLVERLLKSYKELDQWTEKDNEFIVSVKFTSKGDDFNGKKN